MAGDEKRMGRRPLGLAPMLMLLLVAPASAGEKVLPARDIKKIVLIHYATGGDAFAKPSTPAPPLPEPIDTYFQILGWMWNASSGGVRFTTDTDYAPVGALAAMEAALAARHAATDAERLTGYPKALAVTFVRYDSAARETAKMSLESGDIRGTAELCGP